MGEFLPRHTPIRQCQSQINDKTSSHLADTSSTRLPLRVASVLGFKAKPVASASHRQRLWTRAFPPELRDRLLTSLLNGTRPGRGSSTGPSLCQPFSHKCVTNTSLVLPPWPCLIDKAVMVTTVKHPGRGATKKRGTH